MSFCAYGAQIKLTPTLPLLNIGEMKLVCFYDLFISLLPPPAYMQEHQGPANGLGPDPQVFIQDSASVAKYFPSLLK